MVTVDGLLPVLGWRAGHLGGRVFLLLGPGRSNTMPALTGWARRSQAPFVNDPGGPGGPTAAPHGLRTAATAIRHAEIVPLMTSAR